MSLDVYLCDPEPVFCYECGCNTKKVETYSANITHNLGGMAEAAGIYKHLWRPEELEITTAKQLIEPLTAGLALLKSDPERFKKHNAPNGWGLYENFVPWLEKYIEACVTSPDALVKVSR